LALDDPQKALPWVEGRIGLALAESQVAAVRLALMSILGESFEVAFVSGLCRPGTLLLHGLHSVCGIGPTRRTLSPKMVS
jgi:hypothetical protein